MKMETKKEKAVLLNSFKTVRADGHAVRTIYGMTQHGVIQIERRILSAELNKGFTPLRKFGKMIYQYESMTFKLDSFITIAKDISNNCGALISTDIIRSTDVICNPNDKHIVEIY